MYPKKITNRKGNFFQILPPCLFVTFGGLNSNILIGSQSIPITVYRRNFIFNGLFRKTNRGILGNFES